MIEDLNGFIFSSKTPFEVKALRTFQFQYHNNPLYKRFADSLNCNPATITCIKQIPFLPISFFKSHKVTSGEFFSELVFSSSGTTNTHNSKHFVKEAALYEASFVGGFNLFYGNIQDYCVLGLLPSYLEREGSSLVYMVEKLMQLSGHYLNGFHLYDHEALFKKLELLEKQKQKTLLVGVSFALLDFAEKYSMPLKYTTVMETGGMKGRKKETVREEVHEQIKKAFSLNEVHSEYGMTELLSQAYATRDGVFKTPPWMKVFIREEDDPLTMSIPIVNKGSVGAINVIDLANYYSCSFIATDDIGRHNPDGSFEVLGRMDNSDIRGCSLMAL